MGQRRKKKLAGDVAAFLRQYERKAYPTHDPIGRGYDRELEAKIKQMRPEELDTLMRDEVEGDPPSEQDAEPGAAPLRDHHGIE